MAYDGEGWLFAKRATLMGYFGWSEHYTLFGIIGARSWAYYAHAIENRASLFGSGVKKTTKGYIAQEIDIILARRKRK